VKTIHGLSENSVTYTGLAKITLFTLLVTQLRRFCVSMCSFVNREAVVRVKWRHLVTPQHMWYTLWSAVAGR